MSLLDTASEDTYFSLIRRLVVWHCLVEVGAGHGNGRCSCSHVHNGV